MPDVDWRRIKVHKSARSRRHESNLCGTTYVSQNITGNSSTLYRCDFSSAKDAAATYLISENSDQSLSSNIAKGDLVVDSSLLGQLASSWPQVQVNNSRDPGYYRQAIQHSRKFYIQLKISVREDSGTLNKPKRGIHTRPWPGHLPVPCEC